MCSWSDVTRVCSRWPGRPGLVRSWAVIPIGTCRPNWKGWTKSRTAQPLGGSVFLVQSWWVSLDVGAGRTEGRTIGTLEPGAESVHPSSVNLMLGAQMSPILSS